MAAVESARGATEDMVAQRGQRWSVETADSLIVSAFSALENLTVAGRPTQAWAPPSGFWETANGWIRLHGNYPHHAAAVERALGAGDPVTLERVVATMTADEVETAVVGAGGVAAAVRTPEQWRRHPQAVATCDDPWVTVTPVGTRRRLHGGVLPLDGVRILDLTRVIAGPSCTQLLACLGADVLRLDPPDRPELGDQYLSNGMGKRSTVADLRARAAEVEGLLTDADVIVLGYRPGSLHRFGFDPEGLLDRHAHLVVASLSAWGEAGPWGQRSGFDSIVQAATGIAASCSAPSADTDAPRRARPGALPVQALDHATGYRLATGVMGLLARGQAGLVRASLLGAARELMAWPPPPDGPRVPPADRRTEVTGPDCRLRVAPPALALDGRALERPVRRYGGDPLRWW